MAQAVFLFVVMTACTTFNIITLEDPPSRGHAIARGILTVVCALLAVFWGSQIISLL